MGRLGLEDQDEDLIGHNSKTSAIQVEMWVNRGRRASLIAMSLAAAFETDILGRPMRSKLPWSFTRQMNACTAMEGQDK